MRVVTIGAFAKAVVVTAVHGDARRHNYIEKPNVLGPIVGRLCGACDE